MYLIRLNFLELNAVYKHPIFHTPYICPPVRQLVIFFIFVIQSAMQTSGRNFNQNLFPFLRALAQCLR